MADVVTEHYRRLGKDYDRHLLYSPDFVRTLTSKMVEKLDLKEDDRLVDLGGGTGMYSIDILKQVPLKHPVLCVDPFPEMLKNIPPDSGIEPVEAGALEFSEEDREYDKVLIKEAVHHVDDKRRLIENLYKRLPKGGRVLLVHVPPNLDYPLFKKALDRALNWHADPNELESLLKEAGFTVDRDFVDFPHKLPKEKYFEMVGAQYMSVLSSFSQDEIVEGLKEMEKMHADKDTLEFIDHFDYVTGIK